jgi:hypothetical protein
MGNTMKVHTKLFCSILILFVVTLAGCTKKSAATDLFIDEAYDGKQYGNVLVIGLAEKMTFRNLFEGQIVRQLKERGVEAVPSYIILPENKELTREIVLSAIEKSNIDNVLITSLAGKSTKTVLYSTSDVNPYTYFNSSYSLIQNSGTKPSYNVEVLFLKTNLYDVSSEKLVWSMAYESEVTYNTKSLSSVVTFVINQLRDDGLI